MKQILIFCIVFFCSLCQLRTKNLNYQPLIKSRCTWSRGKLNYRWEETPAEGCKICHCVVEGSTLWQDCKTHPRPTSWMKGCRVMRNGCEYVAMRTDRRNSYCTVFAYTTYHYRIWIAVRGN